MTIYRLKYYLQKTNKKEFPGSLAVKVRIPVKNLALSLLWLKFDPWPRSFCIPRVWPKKKKRNSEPIYRRETDSQTWRVDLWLPRRRGREWNRLGVYR